MSKHEKHVRRERRKSDRGRRERARTRTDRHPTSHIRHGGAAALAAAAVIAAGTQAYAERIRFDNPAHGDAGHFHWPEPSGLETYLDVTLPASSQPVVGYAGYVAHSTARQGPYYVNSGYGGMSFETNYWGYGYLVPHNVGDIIPSGSPFGYTYSYISNGPYKSLLPEGELTYLGAVLGVTGPVYCFDGAGCYGDVHFGWVAGVRTGTEFEAFAWGYETEIGVAIPAGAPEPGTLALLAFGALAATRRRRSA